MPRKPFVPGAALVAAAALAVGLTGCTGGSSTDDDAADAKAGGATSSSQAAEPGRYQTLPEACGLPARGTVRGACCPATAGSPRRPRRRRSTAARPTSPTTPTAASAAAGSARPPRAPAI